MRPALLLFALLACEALAAGGRYEGTRRSYLDYLYGLGSSAALSSFASSSGALPLCAADPGCVLDCGVGVYDGTEEWQCVDSSGAQVAVTQGTGTTYEGTSFYRSFVDSQVKAVGPLADAKAPYIDAATAQALLGTGFWAGEHTVLLAGRPLSTPTNTVQFSHGRFNETGFYMEGPTSKCTYSSTGAYQSPAQAIAIAGNWLVRSCRRSSSTYTTRANGSQGSVAVAVTAADPAFENMYFGRYRDTGYSSGFLARVRIYDRALSDAELATREALFWGFHGEGSSGTFAGTTDRNSAAGFIGDDGFFAMVGDDAPRVSSKGVLGYGAQTNHQPNSLDTSAVAKVGTPTGCVTGTPTDCNIASGPFSRYAGGPEVDRVGDDDPTSFEGLYYSVATTAGEQVTLTCTLASGTGSSPRITYSGVKDCDFATTATFATFSCSGPSPGAAAEFQLRPAGPLASDVGDILISECQLEKASHAGPPVPCGASACSTVADAHTLPITDWPTTSGEVEFLYTPFASSIVNTRFLMSESGSQVWYVGGNSGGVLAFVYTDAAGVACAAPAATPTWTPHQQYALKVRWSATSAELYRATVTDGVVGSYGAALSTATPTCSWTGFPSTVAVGSRPNATLNAQGFVDPLYAGAPR